MAINGMYLTGYGNESSMMGGADVAVARDAFAATNNPAGMTQLSGQAFEIENDSSFDLQVGHTDVLNNHKPRANTFNTLANAACARRIECTPFAAGGAPLHAGH